jgi:hypothetical protein
MRRVRRLQRSQRAAKLREYKDHVRVKIRDRSYDLMDWLREGTSYERDLKAFAESEVFKELNPYDLPIGDNT